MITVKVDGDTYIRWLQELGDLWFEKGSEPSVVRKRNSGVWQVLRPNPAA
jgi:hypothetical protein